MTCLESKCSTLIHLHRDGKKKLLTNNKHQSFNNNPPPPPKNIDQCDLCTSYKNLKHNWKGVYKGLWRTYNKKVTCEEREDNLTRKKHWIIQIFHALYTIFRKCLEHTSQKYWFSTIRKVSTFSFGVCYTIRLLIHTVWNSRKTGSKWGWNCLLRDKIILYFDNCVCHRRDRFVFAQNSYASQQYQSDIIHKLSEKGHALNECNCMYYLTFVTMIRESNQSLVDFIV